MGVFGNSNSLPISLVISLSQTLKGLHWDQIPGDNDDEVAARGILYLLIFQQLGQLVRWSWGYHVLLAPKDKYPEYQEQIAEEGNHRQEVHDEHEAQALMDDERDEFNDSEGYTTDSQTYEPAGRTPVAGASKVSLIPSDDGLPSKHKLSQNPTALGGNHPTLNGGANEDDDDILSFPRIRHQEDDDAESIEQHGRVKHFWHSTKRSTSAKIRSWKKATSDFGDRIYNGSPKPIQKLLSVLKIVGVKFGAFLWEFMNPPLWAMLIAVLVASIPVLQNIFFQDGSFVKNSVTHAIKSNGGVAVPLILVVLGANLARNTSAREDNLDPEEEKLGTKLLVASLISRMVLPTAIMAPILALTAKHLPISILDDPIFIVVCFLLSGAPSALQLAQICQINNVYEKTMGRVLFQSYVVW